MCVWLLDVSTRTTYTVMGVVAGLGVLSWLIPKKKRSRRTA